MKLTLTFIATLAASGLAHADAKVLEAKIAPADVDQYQWLEDINGGKSMDWVKARNGETMKLLASTPAFDTLKGRILEVLDSQDRIPYVQRLGKYLYNFWRDKEHPRGLWRRATLEEYRKDKPKWTPIIDLDALAKAEKENWVYHGVNCLKPEERHCLLYLSRGGADADVVREYDLEKLAFVKKGFTLPEAKSNVNWKDANTLYVGTDFGPGSMTKSGYPRICKLWKRGTPLSSATLVYAGKMDDNVISCGRDNTPGYEIDFVYRGIDDYNSETYVLGRNGSMTYVDVPLDVQTQAMRGWLLIQTRKPWTLGGKSYVPGSLLAAKLDDWLAGKRELAVLFEPTETTSLGDFSWTKNHVLVNELEDVVSRVEVLTPNADGTWQHAPLAGAPELSTVLAGGTNPDRDDEYMLNITGYLSPATLARGVIGQGAPELLKRAPAFFDAAHYSVARHFVKSKDGARIPYFVIGPKSIVADGKRPTLLYGYGGFEISLQPYYNGAMGRAWLEQGGVYVVANIRGGGEYGPKWHQAALKQNRLRAYEDFAAVAQDLIAQKITTPAHLGIQGGSNGGLLMGNMLTLYPQLFGAVVSEVPLLDMKRYTHLSAGASWIAEYGDPDQPSEWAYIKSFSPYHNAKKGIKYPATLFVTSTRDDRVGPAHARKMAAKMLDFGDDVQFYENIEGGHGAAADNAQRAFMETLSFTFLWNHVK